MEGQWDIGEGAMHIDEENERHNGCTPEDEWEQEFRNEEIDV